MKKTLAGALALLLLLLSFSALAEGNLLVNGGFEEFGKDGSPKEWYSIAYRNQAGYSTLKITEETAHSGTHCAMIENTGSNDARFVYDAEVEPNKLYKLSAYVRVDRPIESGNGANLALEDFICTSECIKKPTDGWQLLEWYGQTGEDQDMLTFGVRLGGYGRESIGKVYFDDVTLEEVDKLPLGVYAQPWFDESEPVIEADPSTEEDSDALVQKRLIWKLLVVVLFLAVYFLLRKGSFLQKPFVTILFAVMMTIALILRIVLAMNCEGYQVDINCFKAWSTRMATVGPVRFYAEDYFCDYPPGAMLLLYPIGLLLKAFPTGSESLLAVKLLPILADMASAFIIWIWACRKSKRSAGFLLSGLILLNPAVLVTGAAWGQIDSVLALLLLLTAWFVMEKKWQIAIPVYVFAVLVKPQALLVGPVLLACLVFSLIRSPKEERVRELVKTVIGIGIGAVLTLLIALPFCIGKEKPFRWLIGQYASTLGSYDYAVLNAANLYYLFGGNWRPMGNAAPPLMMILLGAGSLVTAGILLLKKGRSARSLCFAVLFLCLTVFLTVLCFCSASFGLLGYGLLAFVYLFVILQLVFDREASHLPFYLALVLTGLFVLGPKIHERYLFPALLLYLLAYLSTGDRRTVGLCMGFSVTTFLNTSVILTNSILLGSAYGHLSDNTALLNILLCIANILLMGYAAFVSLKGLQCREWAPLPAGNEVRSEERRSERIRQLLQPSSPKLGLRWADYVIMAGVTLLYALLCFTNLGSTVAPQTAYVSSSPDEEVVLKLPEETEFSILYYGGVSYHDFYIATGSDGTNWSEDVPCQMNEGLCYRWNYALTSTRDEDGISYASNSPNNVLWFKGQYILLKPQSAALNLWEIVARNRKGENLKLELVSQSGNISQDIAEQYPAAHLVDEPQSCVGEPSWYNSTYFDEIYYARTAWEFTQGQTIYETSHPPLGKLMMAASVKLFGMTPFAWRFPGALLGTLMLPLMYLLAYQLLHKRSAAVGAMGAMALGLMHFTQTRITTIDTYPVFFIMLSFFFMFRYLQSDFFAFSDPEKPKALDGCFLRSMGTLLCCGISMGLAIASKWIGLYAAVGLAILLFGYLIRRLLQYFAAVSQAEKQAEAAFLETFRDIGESVDTRHHSKKQPEKQPEKAKPDRIRNALDHTPGRILFTLLFCILFFIVIPAAIYYVCYIPYFVSSGGITLSKVISTQESMFRYHSSKGLGMDHPFYSPWWQWPLLMKPMWFVQDAYEPAGYASTILVFGNQWVFYLGALAILAAIAYVIIRRMKAPSLAQSAEAIKVPYMLLIGFAAQYVPWMLVPRGTYMYHYFAAAPFLILATVWCISLLPKARTRWIVTGVYLVGALLFFAIFFPYASGLLTETAVLDKIRKLYALMKNLPGCASYFNLWY